MKFYYLVLIFFVSLCGGIVKAQNRYDTAAEAPIINTYVPMSHEEMMLRAAAVVWKERQAQERFEKYFRTAYGYLQKKQIGYFIRYANAALNTGYYNMLLYSNLGISYCLLGQQRKGKKYLKKASKEGFLEADYALLAIKKKEVLSYSWFIMNVMSFMKDGILSKNK